MQKLNIAFPIAAPLEIILPCNVITKRCQCFRLHNNIIIPHDFKFIITGQIPFHLVSETKQKILENISTVI
ncbi:hypothetical protein T10_7897 [Trichinella papuae]|uniref:Uncharacterized protein n=1 Tax=Trichinella papuae TaxID=268474 RepID=A0A0V1MAW8_9BILA|nr:hypothetical protein T10_7897 [Trichinella papuae]